MFNLLWLHNTTQKLTDTWIFNVRCGFREYCSYKEASPFNQFSSFELYRRTCCKSAWATHLVPRVYSSASFHALHSSFIKLFILKESALLITANDTHIRCRRAPFKNESTFLSLGEDVTNYTLLVHWNKLPLVFFQAKTGQKISPMSPTKAYSDYSVCFVYTLHWRLLLAVCENSKKASTLHTTAKTHNISWCLSCTYVSVIYCTFSHARVGFNILVKQADL